MRIVMSGASGMIGTALSKLLESRGDEVIRLVRRPAANNKEWSWDPSAGVLDEAVLDGADAVVNLSGAGIGDRPWTKNRIRVLHDSRLQPTRTLTAAMGRLGSPPRAFVSQSASGYYGASRREVLHEDSAPGEGGVLAPLCVQWEEAARTAPDGVRVVTPRTGVVLSTQGGALGPLLPLLKVGLGGPFGNGRQYWPWITLADEASAMAFLVDSQLEGAVNLCAPGLADVNTIVARLAEGFHRPAFLRVPRPALRLVLGGLADELVMADQAMYPGKLAGAGFTWQHPELRQAVAWLTSQPGR